MHAADSASRRAFCAVAGSACTSQPPASLYLQNYYEMLSIRVYLRLASFDMVWVQVSSLEMGEPELAWAGIIGMSTCEQYRQLQSRQHVICCSWCVVFCLNEFELGLRIDATYIIKKNHCTLPPFFTFWIKSHALLFSLQLSNLVSNLKFFTAHSHDLALYLITSVFHFSNFVFKLVEIFLFHLRLVVINFKFNY